MIGMLTGDLAGLARTTGLNAATYALPHLAFGPITRASLT
jgi:hypothetical protein